MPKLRYVEYNGKNATLTEWAQITGITRETIRQRLERGWSIDEALTTQTPSMRNDDHIHTSVRLTVDEMEYLKKVGDGILIDGLRKIILYHQKGNTDDN